MEISILSGTWKQWPKPSWQDPPPDQNKNDRMYK